MATILPPAKQEENELYFKKIEKNNMEKFVENYIKLGADPVAAYKKTYSKELWKTEATAKKRSFELLKDVKFNEVRDTALEDLRDMYKEEIAIVFNYLTETIKNDTFYSYKHHYDTTTKKAKQYRVKENISHTAKNKASELILKTMGYLDKKETNVNIVHNEYEVVDKMINDILEETGA